MAFKEMLCDISEDSRGILTVHSLTADDDERVEDLLDAAAAAGLMIGRIEHV